tara:strand:+ start:1760 stop:1945 length:186 start_codon:yes stop_codon:yes gene_type:complete
MPGTNRPKSVAQFDPSYPYGLRQAVSKPPFYVLKVVEVIAKSLIKQKPLKQIEKLDQLLPL